MPIGRREPPIAECGSDGAVGDLCADLGVHGGVERLAVVGQLGVKRGDPLHQPDGLPPAGTQHGAFSAGTLDRDGADLSVSQRFTRIDPQIDRPEQCGQRVHSACRSPGHLLLSHNQDPNYLARPRSVR